MWFVEQAGNNVGRIATSGTVTELAIPTAASGSTQIVAGPGDGFMWITETQSRKVTRIARLGARSRSFHPPPAKRLLASPPAPTETSGTRWGPILR